MGNAIGREESGTEYGRGGDDDNDGDSVRSNGDILPGENDVPMRYLSGSAVSTDVRRNAFAPSAFPAGSRSPMLISPQIPIAPLQRSDGSPSLSQTWQSDSQDHMDPGQGIPTIITWNYGGNDVLVEGSWDNWTSRKRMQRSGKDCSVLLVLPSGIYHYKFIIDGEYRYRPELPHITDDKGRICNLLDVHLPLDEIIDSLKNDFDCDGVVAFPIMSLGSRQIILNFHEDFMPEYPGSIAEFEAPPSPESGYGQAPSAEEDFAKEPSAVPPQLHLTVLGPENPEEPIPSSRPQHVVLNHLFIEKGRSSQSVVALGLTHRFESKYVTVVLYKPVKR